MLILTPNLFINKLWFTEQGASSDGLIITEFPAAKAGANFFTVINNG